ncbi:hypothetical protein L0152_07255 [bacterium]|nr:hypothetical protein [bacterium]
MSEWFRQLNLKSIGLFILSLLILFGSPELIAILKENFGIGEQIAKYLTGSASIASLILAWYTKSPKETPFGN